MINNPTASKLQLCNCDVELNVANKEASQKRDGSFIKFPHKDLKVMFRL